MRILIAEDDSAIAAALKASLAECGHAVDNVDDGVSADHALSNDAYDLLVLDLGLPRMEGNQVLRLARARGSNIAVMVITARDRVADRVQMLDSGADDYLVKPFELAEFLARSRALLRRRSSGGVPEVVVGRLRVNIGARRAWLDDAPLELTAREYSLLEALLARQQRVVSRAQLTEALCDWEQDLTSNGLDISIHRLRRKLHNSGAHIRTIRGLGYLLEPTETGQAIALDA
ncbi:response regulator [Cognatiluteimonas profundi]|uniref:response regulator n=1 Tax=Cognatiluteimonas profundi TaxID=2594501 RepID=UPI00131E0CD8|nr:response regulator transcription factor [Lysobacter profundi]